ncbi:hypothetical protein [Actinoplanes siamensis]|uniref:Fibronectin type-III domain-containing protein n=1 Tax=Actinoplanes siamensis TaxID=1223317 RepID=A0A919TLP2_9ACTN|nr:hypothetical protein [Actinoplanes siamensis]GIF06310.1 hypothetical protein Asi03nite_38480 [Actinoplanes siamensis]
MRRRTAIALVAATVGGAVAAGSRLDAWAGWTVPAAPAQGTVRAGQMPAVRNLAVTPDGADLTFTWDEARFASGAAVGGYLVLSAAGPVCQTESERLTCSYSGGGAAGGTFVVRARAGAGWMGPVSAAVTYVPEDRKDPGVATAPAASGPKAGASAPRATPPPAATGDTPAENAPMATTPAPEATTATTTGTPSAPAVTPDGTAYPTETSAAGRSRSASRRQRI